MSENNWRVDAISNFGKEDFAEYTVLDRVALSEEQAKRIAGILNENCHDGCPVWYIARHENTKLWRGIEELI